MMYVLQKKLYYFYHNNGRITVVARDAEQGATISVTC